MVLVVGGVVVAFFLGGGGGDGEVTSSSGLTPGNGSIVTSHGDGWPAEAAPPVRPGDRDHDWDAFDPRSGSFLYVSHWSASRMWILDEDGREEADFDCGSPSCGWGAVFGPGPDEVTLLPSDPERHRNLLEELQVTGWDGTVRDTVDLAAVVGREADGTLDRELAGLAWSPDGTRLAVGTVAGPDCDPSHDPCAAQVWTVDRHGRDPRLVYRAPSSGQPPAIGDVAWSPDGRRLGVVVAPSSPGRPAWPRLVMLRLQPDGTVREGSIHCYDRGRPPGSVLGQSSYGSSFAFAWSPDGTRIAVVGTIGLEEISAVDGQVVARHPGGGADEFGLTPDLAWLPAD